MCVIAENQQNKSQLLSNMIFSTDDTFIHVETPHTHHTTTVQVEQVYT